MKKTLPLLLLTLLILFACEDSSSNNAGGGTSAETTTSWTLSGSIDFSGCYSADDHDVKVAAFYTGAAYTSSNFGDPLVSNVIDLGNGTAASTVNFTLNIDVSQITPASDAYSYVYLMAWQDDNDNGAFDDTTKINVKPNDDDTVFGDVFSARFIYTYDDPNWNVVKSNLDYEIITAANNTFTGASLNDGGYLW